MLVQRRPATAARTSCLPGQPDLHVSFTCGSRLFQLNNTAMDEGLASGCTIHVLRRLRGVARARGVGVEFTPGQWQCMVRGADRCWPARPPCHRCAQPRGTLLLAHAGGPPAHIPCWFLDVFPFSRIMVVLLLPLVLPSSLGWCLVPSVRPLLLRVARFLRQPGRLVSVPKAPLLARVLVFCRLVLLLTLLKTKNTGLRPLLPPLSLVPPSALQRLL